MNIYLIILWIIIGYVIGSIPWALVIGKVFFKKDIRNYGSGNLGGTNAGRVLGKPIGFLVIFLDSLKALLVMIVCNFCFKEALPFAGLAVCIGHCYPLFANFKGGKAVSCSYGYLLGLGLFVTHDVLFTFFLPLGIFLIIFFMFNMVSLASMISLLVAGIIFLIKYNSLGLTSYLVLILAIFVIIKHRANIKRILNNEESKIHLFK